ncbi:MAG: hypothetical protein AAF386_08105 [Pseudomonadota bacterium]
MKAPWHFWVLALLGLVWFAGGAYDYVMTSYGNEDYLSILTPEQRAWIDTRPMWFTVVWAVSVWSAVLAMVAMILRSRVAGHLMLLSLVAYIPSLIWSYVLSTPTAFDVTGMIGVGFSVVIFVTLVFFISYCASMARRGVLR